MQARHEKERESARAAGWSGYAAGVIPNPFTSIPNGREVFAWGLYDLANQSFQLLVNTLLFAIYVKQVVAPTPEAGDRAWIIFVGVSMVLAVLVSPIVGAMADARAWKKPMLMATGVVASVLTAALAFLGPGHLWLAGVLYITAAFAVNLGENFLGSFLPELADERSMGRISALGWSMSYAGALILLGITALLVFVLGFEQPAQWRWIFLLAGLWFLGGILPAMVLLRERAKPRPAELRRNLARDTLAQIVESTRQARRYRQLLRFLAVFFVYSLGTYSVIFYAGKIGERLGFGIGELCLLALVMAFTAGISAVLAARYQDRLGHRRTIMIVLGVWAVSTLGLAFNNLLGGGPEWFWLISAGVGLGLGGIGTGSRALVGALTPPAKAGEFFGLWGLVFKLAGVVGPVCFGVVSLTHATAGLFVLAGFFVAGLLLMPLIDEREGIAAARGAASPGSP